MFEKTNTIEGGPFIPVETSSPFFVVHQIEAESGQETSTAPQFSESAINDNNNR